MIDSPALGWGVQIDRVEIKDVALPDSMKRSIARQAEAERERRARVITAEGELQASEKLAQAAEVMAEHPAALQLRLLETVVEVAAEKNSTLVLPFPVELLRFLERATPQASERWDKATGTDAGAASKAETLPLEPPRIPDNARGLELHAPHRGHIPAGSVTSETSRPITGRRAPRQASGCLGRGDPAAVVVIAHPSSTHRWGAIDRPPCDGSNSSMRPVPRSRSSSFIDTLSSIRRCENFEQHVSKNGTTMTVGPLGMSLYTVEEMTSTLMPVSVVQMSPSPWGSAQRCANSSRLRSATSRLNAVPSGRARICRIIDWCTRDNPASPADRNRPVFDRELRCHTGSRLNWRDLDGSVSRPTFALVGLPPRSLPSSGAPRRSKCGRPMGPAGATSMQAWLGCRAGCQSADRRRSTRHRC